MYLLNLNLTVVIIKKFLFFFSLYPLYYKKLEKARLYDLNNFLNIEKFNLNN